MAVTPRSCDVVEPLHQTGEIADAVAVGVVERLDVQLVDDRVLVPVADGAIDARLAACAVSAARNRSSARGGSKIVMRVLPGREPPDHIGPSCGSSSMCWTLPRPREAAAGDEILDGDGGIVRQAELPQRQFEVAP